MSKLLNIAKTDENPLYIDPSEVTALHVDRAKEELHLFNGSGELLWIKYKDWGVDVDEALQKLEQNGTPMVCFPVRVKEDGREFLNYISPKAVAYITVSEPAKDGTVGVIAGVKGVGREETWTGGMTEAEFETIRDAVKSAKNLLEYAPEDAYSRWSSAAALYIDPQSVTRIEDQGSQLIVGFEGAGGLDVQIKEVSIKPFLSPDYVAGDDSPENRRLFNLAFQNLMAYQNQESVKAEQKQARFDFSADITAANKRLINVSSNESANYICKEDVGYVSLRDDAQNGTFSININTQKNAGNPYGASLSLRFKSAAERKKAFETLDKALSAKPPKPPKSSPGRNYKM